MEEPVDLQKNGRDEAAQTTDDSSSNKKNGDEEDQEHFCCSFCQERFLAIEDLLSHIRIHTGGVDSEEDQEDVQVPQKMKRLSVRLPLMKAGEMSKSFESVDVGDIEGGTPQEGEVRSPNPASTSAEPDTCNDEFDRTDNTPGYQCPTCKRRFNRIIHQLNHKCEPTDAVNQLDAINSGLKLYKCVVCKEEFGTRQEKIDHKCLEGDVTGSSPSPNEEGAQESSEEDAEGETYDSDNYEDDSPTESRPKLTIKLPLRKNVGKARRRKAKQVNRCDICHRSFTRSWNLKVHIQKAHPSGALIQPKISSPKAPSPLKVSKSSQQSSRKTNKKFIQNNEAFDFIFTPSYSEKNMVLRRMSSSNAYECPLCGKTMERREAILAHIRDHRGELPYLCSHCDFSCAHSAKVLKHLLQMHSISQPNTPPDFEASKVIAQGTDWQPRKEPYRNFYKIVRSEKERMYKPKKDKDTGAFMCPICHKVYARFGVAQVHIRIHTGEAPFRCLLCEYQGKQQSLILAHLEHNHKDVISASNSSKDEEVDAEQAIEEDNNVDEEAWEKSIDFEEGIIKDDKDESEGASQDAESEESMEELEEEERSPDVQDQAEHEKYDFGFRPTQDELDRVLFRSSVTKMYLCNQCPKEIKEKEIMLAHIRTHTGDKAYYCSHCEFGSAHDAAMRKHLLNVHGVKHAKRPDNTTHTTIRLITGTPPPHSVFVGRKSGESPQRLSTKKQKTPAKKPMQEKTASPKPVEKKVLTPKSVKKQPPKETKPPTGGPSYADFYVVNKSEKEEECKPQRNTTTGLYKCHFCKLESYSFKTVVIHTRSHTGEKPYKCRLCTFSGGQSSHVIRHLKNTHRVSLEGADESDDADEEPPAEDTKENEVDGEEEEVQEPQPEEEIEQEKDDHVPSDREADTVEQEEEEMGQGSDVDLDPVDYFAPSVPEEPVAPVDIPIPKEFLKDEDSLGDDTVEEGSQEGGDNDPDWETWMDKRGLSQEVASAYKGKGKMKITPPKTASVNYLFTPSEGEKALKLDRGADKQFGCPTCGKRMRELEIILAHIRTHTGDKPYSCCHCDFTSAHIASIRKHCTKTHSVKKPVPGSDHNTPLIPSGKSNRPPATMLVTKRKPVTKSFDNDPSSGDGLDFEERHYSEGTEGFINQFFKVVKKAKTTDKQYLPTREALTGRAQCKICMNTFSSYGKAVVHIRSHTGEKPYRCVLCDYSSSQNPNMKRHIRNQHREVLVGSGAELPNRDRKTTDPADEEDAQDQFTDMDTGTLDDEGNDLSGPSMVQRTDFLSQAVVAERQSNQPGRPDYLYEPTERMRNFEPKRSSETGMFECTYCSSQFYGSKKIETHVLKHTGEKPYLCMHCDFKSAYSFVMYRHLLKRHNIQTLKHPGGASDDQEDNGELELQEGASFTEAPENDSAYTTSKPTVSENDSAYTTSKPTASESVSAYKTSKPTASESVSAYTITTATPPVPESPPPAAAPLPQSYPEGQFDFVFRPSEFELNQKIESLGGCKLKCPHCNKVMGNRKKIVTHIRTHTGEKPFHCCHCNFKTAYKFVIQTHMKGIHKIFLPQGDDDLIEAQQLQDACASALATKGSEPNGDQITGVNIKQEPITIKQEPLDETDEMNRSTGEMMVDMSSVEEDDTESMDDGEGSNYSIQKEGQKADCVFKPSEEERDRKLYRPNPSGPCQCPFCHRWLQGLENMRAHIRGHTGEKPYQCSHCDQKSAHFAAMKRHIMKVHLKMRPVMPGDVTLHPKLKVKTKRPGLVMKFKHVRDPRNPVKLNLMKGRSLLASKPNVPAIKPRGAPAAFASRDRTLTQFYRNFYEVNKTEDLKKFTPKKDPATKMFHCHFCGKQFNYHTEAQVHTRTHTGEKPYHCLVCEYKGSQWTNIVRHITCVHKKLLETKQREAGIGNLAPLEDEGSTTLVSDAGTSPPPALQHWSLRKPVKNKVPVKKPVLSPPAINTPATVTPATINPATITPATVSAKSRGDYIFNPSPEERKRVIVPSSKTGLYSCMFCKKKLPNLGKIVTHIRTHTGDKPFTCSHCNFKSAYKFVIRQHLIGKHGIKWPKQVDEGAPEDEVRKEDGDQMEDSHVEKDAPIEMHIKVPSMEGREQIKISGSDSDFRFQPSEREASMELLRQSKTGCFECPFCGRQFSSNETMKAHIRGHTGDKAYYCNHCEFASAHIKSIRNHVQKVHSITHPRRFEGKHVAPQQQLVPSVGMIPKEVYMKYVGVNKMGTKKYPPKRNPRTGRFKCHFCVMESKQLYTVEIHTMRHTGEKPYYCKLCEYKATRQWLVTQHLQTNHKHIMAADEDMALVPKDVESPLPVTLKIPQPKPPVTSTAGATKIVVCRSAKTGMFYCSECRKEFLTSGQCKEHVNTHNGVKPYKCPFCDHRSAHGGAMRNHMKIQHDNDTEDLKKWYSYNMGEMAMNHVFQKDHEGKYICSYCTKKSGSLNSARKHLCVHTGEKPYSCKLCSFKAIHNISVRLHVTSHHKQITSAFSQSDKQLALSAQTGQNSIGALGKFEEGGDEKEEEDDEDEWEDDENLAMEEEELSSDAQHTLGSMEKVLDKVQGASPLAAVAPVGQTSVKDADFLYVPSEVDRDTVLQRSRESQMYECPICDKQMTNTRTMRAHIRLHKGEKAYHCCHCDYKSAHYSVLRKHVVQVHKIERPRMAQDSEEVDMPWVRPEPPPPPKDPREVEPTALSDLQLSNPCKIPTNMNADTDQGFLFDANEDEKLSWQELQTSGSCQCPQCGKHCSSPIRTLQHMRTHTGAKPYHCRYCSFRSAYDTSMRSHVKTMHEVGPGWNHSAEDRALQQGVEDNRLQKKLSEIKALVARNTASDNLDVKIKKEPQDNGYENKPSETTENSPETEMAWTFNEADQSATLVPQYMAPPIIDDDNSGVSTPLPESSEDSEDQAIIDSEEQSPSMMSRYQLIRSKPIDATLNGDFTYEPSQEEKDRVVPRLSSGMYRCPYCPQEITSVDKIKAHIRKHTGDRPYQCLHCKFTSAYRFVIRTHIKNLHKVPEPKQDKSAQQTIRDTFRESLGHFAEDMPRDEPNHGERLDMYKAGHVNENRSSPMGKICWADHFKYIPSESEKKLVLNRCSTTMKYQCPECTKVLSNLDVMRAHVRTHTGEKPYYCCHCDFQSAHYDSIRKHLIVIHKMKYDGGDVAKDSVEIGDEVEVDLAEQQWREHYTKPPATSVIDSIGKKGSDFVFRPSESEKKCVLKQSPDTGLLQCPFCTKEHRQTDGMLAHIRTHTGDKPYRCCHCGYVCENLSAIKLHLYIVHNLSKPSRPDHVMLKPPPIVKSPLVAKEGEELGETDKYRHLFDIVRETKKDRKGQTFQRNPVTRAYKCNYCPKESNHHYVIQIHMRIHTGEKPYQCRLCDYTGAQQSRILFHLKGKHADYLKSQGIDQEPVSVPPPEPVEGVVIGRSRQQQVVSAAGAVGEEHFMPKLNVDFTVDRIESEEILLEKLQVNRDYNCPTCGKRCANAVRTIEHMRQHTGAKPYACVRCPTRSAYDRAIRNHVLLQHGRNAKEKAKLYTFHPGKIERSLELRKDPTNDRFMCPFCNKTFRDVNLARSHIRIHTGETPYKCKICQFKGANTRAIQVHIERVHGNRGSNTDLLVSADLSVDDNESPSKRLKLADDSQYLGTPTTSNTPIMSDDELSSNVEHDNEIPTEKIPKMALIGAKAGVDFICDKVETAKMYCRDPATGGYKCLYCDKVLKSRGVSKIKNHLLLHIGAKPFKCLHCDFRTAHDGAIRSHVLSQHRQMSQYVKLYKFKVGKIERSLRLEQDQNNRYRCPYCSKRHRDVTVIKKHIRSHTGEKPYHCKKCSYMATMKWSVILHSQRQHKIRKSSSKMLGQNGKSVAAGKKIGDGSKDADMKDAEFTTGNQEKFIAETSLACEGVEHMGIDEVSKQSDKTQDEGGNNNEESENNNTAGSKTDEEIIPADDTEEENQKDKTTDKPETDADSKESASMEKVDGVESKSEAQIHSDETDSTELDIISRLTAELVDKTVSKLETDIEVEENVTTKEIKNPLNANTIGKLETDGGAATEEGTARPVVAKEVESKGLEVADVDKTSVVAKVRTGHGMKVESVVEKLNQAGATANNNEKEQIKNEKEVNQKDEKEENKLADQDGSDIQVADDEEEEFEAMVTQQIASRTPNTPDYLFKPSDEEKSIPKSNATGAFECPKCAKQFSDILVMQTHVRKHTGDTPYHCNHCSFRSARFPEIRQHLLFQHKIYRPKSEQHCNSVASKSKDQESSHETAPFSSKPAVAENLNSLFTYVAPKTCNYNPVRNPLSGLFECPVCGSTTRRSNSARVHYRIHTGEKPYHCLMCSYKGAQQSRVVTHIKYNHKDAMVIKEAPSVQPRDEQTIEKLEKFVSRSVEQPKPIQDEVIDDIEDEIMSDEDSLVIDETFNDIGAGTKRKMEDDGTSDMLSARSAHQPLWKKGYEYRPSEEENELLIEQDSNGVFLCPICPHKHKLKNVVRNHIRKHTGEKPYFCCHCDFTTANFSSIRTHLIQAHKSMPHKQEAAIAQPDVVASINKKARLSEVDAVVNEELATEGTQNEGYTFTRSLLEKSLRLPRTGNGKYQCPYCTYEYGALAIVMAHVRTHTGDKPFQCSYCPYSAADYSAMRKHLIKKHDKWQPKSKVWSAVSVNQSESVVETKPPADKPTESLHYTFQCGDAEKGLSFHKSDSGLYQCPYCPHQHKKKSVVRAHVRKHTGEKPYLCKHCTFKCANFSWMREHLIKRHDLTASQMSQKRKGKEIQKGKPTSSPSKSPVPSNAGSKSPVSSVGAPPQKSPKCDFLFAPSDTEKHVELSRTSSGSYICVFCKKELRIMNNMRAHIRGHIGDKPYYCTRCQFQAAHVQAVHRHLFTTHRIRNGKGQKCKKQVAIAMTQPQKSPPRSSQTPPIPVVQPLKSSIGGSPPVATNSSPIMHGILTTPRRSEIRTPSASQDRQQAYSTAAPKSSQEKEKSAKYVYEETAQEIALLKSLQSSNTLQCPHCGHKFSSISRTMEHVRKHTGTKPYRCLICNFKSAYEGCISRHVSLKHELSAQQLAQFFTFKIGDIEKSIDLQKNPETGHFKCPFCEKSWPESAKVKRHMCIHTGEKPYRCHLCGFGAVDKSSMVHHLEMSHKKHITEVRGVVSDNLLNVPYTSPAASPPPPARTTPQGRPNFHVEAKDPTKLVLHRVATHKNKSEVMTKKPFQRQEPRGSILNVPSPSNMVPPDSCGYTYIPSPSEKGLLDKLNVEGKLKCQYCAKICHSAARTLEHIRMHTGEKPYACDHCSFQSAYEGVMRKHVMVRHGKGSGLSILYSFKAGKILKGIEFEREETTGRYKCPFCTRTTTSLTGAKRHVCTHTGEKPYKCKLCSYSANERSTILWHIDRNHKNADEHLPDDKPMHHQTQQLGGQHRMVEQRKAAVTHALGLAPTVSPADASRSKRNMLSSNRRGQIDFSPGQQQFKKFHVEAGDSQAISKLFTFEPGKIERSLNLQRDPVNGRYLCPFCEQTSRDLTNAKNHVRVHIGEKPFKCSLCDYASVQRSLVIAHIEKHHVVYPSSGYQQHTTPPMRRQDPSGYANPPKLLPSAMASNTRKSPSAPRYIEPPQLPPQYDNMPLDLSKPLDLSSSATKKPAEPKRSVENVSHRYNVPDDGVAMDLSSNVAHAEVDSIQESSMDEEEAALLEAEMLAAEEEEMMISDRDDLAMDDEEELTAEDEDRLLEDEEREAANQSHFGDEIIPGKASHKVIATQKPVSLVKPLNPHESNENEFTASTSTTQQPQRNGQEEGQSLIVGAVVQDGDGFANPGRSRRPKSERNIWDMAFNWSKSDEDDYCEKPEAARSLEYPEVQREEVDVVASGDDADMDGSARDEDLVESDANGYPPAMTTSREGSVLERLLQKNRVRRDALDAALANGTDGQRDEHDESIETDLEPIAVCVEPSLVRASPRSSRPDATVDQDLPSNNVWQAMQEATPTKTVPSSDLSSALTPERHGDEQEEMSSPASSGGLPIITNVMSLNPSLWKSP